ncbi:hypothetical protein HK097_009249 [Rhizophlyctis rosea]|uniref:Ubiquitin-like domain-containing protein n=1 Tax=Rhizophlyctis rosea TaxID=64517 RepID=A0AAD5SLQ0_9FUNG|nr:hypothetical protein HK097_009249 [Rhizophlyctis rosea]
MVQHHPEMNLVLHPFLKPLPLFPQSASIYLRIKRQKTVFFVETTPQETVLQLKQKLFNILNREKQVKDMKLEVKQPGKQATAPPTYATLEDSAVLETLGLENDGELFLTFWIPGESNAADGKWEPVDVPEFDPLGDEVEEVPDESEKGKGKTSA